MTDFKRHAERLRDLDARIGSPICLEAADAIDQLLALAKPASSPAGGDVREPTPDMKIGFVDGYEAALRAVEVFRVKVCEPFDSQFEQCKGFVRDMLKHNAEKLRSSLSQSTSAGRVGE